MSIWDVFSNLFSPKPKRPSRYGERKRSGEIHVTDRAKVLAGTHRISGYQAQRLLHGETITVDGKPVSSTMGLAKLRPPIKDLVDPYAREKPRDRRRNERPPSLKHRWRP